MAKCKKKTIWMGYAKHELLFTGWDKGGINTYRGARYFVAVVILLR
jgi:hypothetical protein